jgi:hypothetical protein
VADRLPSWLLTQPERWLVNFACFFIGLGALLPQTGQIVSGWPRWFEYTWGSWMVIGSLITLIAIYTSNRILDRTGALMLATGSVFFGINLYLEYGWGRAFTATIFMGIFVTKLIRFVRSAAVQARMNHYLIEILNGDIPPPEKE